MRRDEEPPADPRHAWLPAVVPADARRYRTDDGGLAETLTRAGAELVAESPDVEIAMSRAPAGDADCVVAAVDFMPPEDWPRLRRLPLGLLGSARARMQMRRARELLRRLGYARTAILPWAENEPVAPAAGPALAPAALVVGHRDLGAPTAVEAAAAAAGFPLGVPPVVRQGVVVVVGDDAVLRVAIGPAAGQIDRAVVALAALTDGVLPADAAALIPWTISEGRAGLARWSLERRVPGAAARTIGSERLLADCTTFLRALFASGGAGPPTSPVDDAAVVGAAVPTAAAAVRRLAERVTATVAHLPRGFAHGDFWSGNVLAVDGRLSGVIDWDAAGPGRLPLLDLLHLRANALRGGRRATSLGEDVVHSLLPWARAGGDGPTRAFAAELGFDVTPTLLEALVAAYWLDYVAYQLRLYVDRARRPRWLRENVTNVAAALGA